MSNLLKIAGLGMILLICSALYAADQQTITIPVLTVKSSIALSDTAGDPVVADLTRSITFEFSAPLNPHTVANEVKLYKVNVSGEQEEPSVTTIDKKTPAVLKLSPKNGGGFTAGEAYKISISANVKSTNGLSLGEEFAGYFAINHPVTFDRKAVAGLRNPRNSIVVISDIHLGVNDDYTEFKKNRDALAQFLGEIKKAPYVKELVIAGDLLDEWFIPATIDTFNGKTQGDFVKALAANNQTVIQAFNGIIKGRKIKVTYVPGNHDLLITAADIESIMPGINQSRDVRGLGAYSPEGQPGMIIEHGHRYNFFCAPDPISNKSIVPGSILPPGYFFTRIATTSVVEGHPKTGHIMPVVTMNQLGESQSLAFSYWSVWKELMTGLPIKEGFDAKIIKTNIDGFTNDYSINDLMPYQLATGGFIDLHLFKGIQDMWDERQKLNQVAVKIPASEAITRAVLADETDDQAVTQYFTNPNSQKRIVVFGHTHEARMIASQNYKGQKTIYANSGTWIDKNKLPTMTFVVITPQKSSTSAPAFVTLYYYSPSGKITKMDVQALMNLKR